MKVENFYDSARLTKMLRICDWGPYDRAARDYRLEKEITDDPDYSRILRLLNNLSVLPEENEQDNDA